MLVYNWRVLSSHSWILLVTNIARSSVTVASMTHENGLGWMILTIWPHSHDCWSHTHVLRARGPEMGKLKCIIYCVYIYIYNIHNIYILHNIHTCVCIYIYYTVYIYIACIYIYIYMYVYIYIYIDPAE